jgi:hypothetical protein
MDQAESEQNCSLQPIYWLGFGRPAQHDAVTHGPDSAIHVAAASRVIDAIAVAHIEAALAAILPDRVLDEPGKGPRKGWIELPSIDPR